jgi:hypothetical protein
LLKIFAVQKLRELKKHCREASIRRRDLANMILWCKAGGPYIHAAHHRRYTPDHLGLTEADLSAIASNGVGRFNPRAQKAANKVFATFEERRMLSGHLFQNLDEWHFFYFDNRDMSRRHNHWEGGPHIHVINHLMPNRSAQSVWSEFCEGNPIMKGALHLRMTRD